MNNMNNRSICTRSGGANRDSIVYTEDGIPVQRLHFFKVPREMREDAMKAYFLSFGNVLELRLGKDPKKKFEPYLSGDVLFDNAEDAAKALECKAPYVDAMEIKVRPSYSWLQPDAYGPTSEDEQPDLGPIGILTDYCWVNILKFLKLRDKVRFARSCHRFRAIYQMATAGQYKSVSKLSFSEMTLWDRRDFYQMSGDQVQDVRCYGHEIADLVAEYCRNLISLDLSNTNVTKYTMLRMPTSIEKLKMGRCSEGENLPIICRHFSKLRKLDLRAVKVPGPAWSYIVKNNCCPSLESLKISLYENNNCEIVAQLPKLKNLTIDTDRSCREAEDMAIYDIYKRQTGLEMIHQLIKHKAEQLERLKVGESICIPTREHFQIAKLTGLRALDLKSQFDMTGDVLKEFVYLKNLEEISIWCADVNYSAVLDLFIGCPKLSHLCCQTKPAYELVLKIVGQVRQEMANKEIHRKLPISLVLNIAHKEINELFQNNPDTVTEDTFKIKSSRIKLTPSDPARVR